jgi:two-component system OmpR family sensor kinase
MVAARLTFRFSVLLLPTMKKKPSYELLFNALNSSLRMDKKNIATFLTEACTLVSTTLDADKSELFIYADALDALVAEGISHQTLSTEERGLGLDIQPLPDGGRIVDSFRTGAVYRSGEVKNDGSELDGMNKRLGIRSQINIPVDLGLGCHGVLVIVSRTKNHFSAPDQLLAEGIATWVSLVYKLAQQTNTISRHSIEQGRLIAAEEIITILAHDLRNLQSPLAMQLERMGLQAKKGLVPSEKDFDRCFLYLDRFDKMLSELLDISRIDNGLFYLRKSDCNLSAFVSGIVEEFAPEVVFLLADLDKKIPSSVDKERVQQCLENVIGNAVKHSSKKVPVTVALTRKCIDGRPTVEICVTNNGPNIPKSLLGSLFDRYTVGPSKKRGLGLGLYLAKQIAIAHAGNIFVTSDNGSTAFTLILPAQ